MFDTARLYYRLEDRHPRERLCSYLTRLSRMRRVASPGTVVADAAHVHVDGQVARLVEVTPQEIQLDHGGRKMREKRWSVSDSRCEEA